MRIGRVKTNYSRHGRALYSSCRIRIFLQLSSIDFLKNFRQDAIALRVQEIFRAIAIVASSKARTICADNGMIFPENDGTVFQTCHEW